MIKRFREWILHRRQIREQRAILLKIPAPKGSRRRIIVERMPHGSHSLTQQFRYTDSGTLCRQDCTVIQSAESIRVAIRKAQEA